MWFILGVGYENQKIINLADYLKTSSIWTISGYGNITINGHFIETQSWLFWCRLLWIQCSQHQNFSIKWPEIVNIFTKTLNTTCFEMISQIHVCSINKNQHLVLNNIHIWWPFASINRIFYNSFNFAIAFKIQDRFQICFFKMPILEIQIPHVASSYYIPPLFLFTIKIYASFLEVF